MNKCGFIDSNLWIYAAIADGSSCAILYSEDMQGGQRIENRLVICNPFS